MEFNHYILTRFNVRVISTVTKQLQVIDITNDVDYLENRFRLFFDYTVPSVLNQCDKNFIWILLFSANTPRRFKNVIDELENQNAFIKAIYIADDEDCNDSLKKYIKENSKEVIVTSRLDNDDALHKDYISTIHEYIKENELKKYVLLFNNGVQYEENSRILTRYHFPKNHFSTLIEFNDDKINTILNFNHMEIAKNVNTVELDNTVPLWLEVVHSTNVSNRMHCSLKSLINDKSFLKRYGVINKKIESGLGSKIRILLNGPINLCRLIRQYGIYGILKKAIGKAKRAIFHEIHTT